MNHNATIQLPEWAIDCWEAAKEKPFRLKEQAMALAIHIAHRNIENGTGGPFGAVVIDTKTLELISIGPNLVATANMSSAHAEIVALTLAQQAMGSWDLSLERDMTLVTSCEPCAMCYGALQWSKINHLIVGSRKEDAEAAGFDEGDKPDDWVGSLNKRGITVERDILRDSANIVFDRYQSLGGVIYGINGEECCCASV